MKRLISKPSIKHSLLSQYLLIVLSAIVILPMTLLVLTMTAYFPVESTDLPDEATKLYRNGPALKDMWHAEAAKLGGASPERIDEALNRIKTKYAEAQLFWVDGRGATRLQLPAGQSLPKQWDAVFTVQFMKDGVGGDDFTVVAFIGNERTEGFMVFKVPRIYMKSKVSVASDRIGTIYVLGLLTVLGLFLFVSLLFFYGIRKRLVRLQTAMSLPPAAGGGIPAPVAILNRDEIGNLENAFNLMVGQLEESRKRESEEDSLRRELIARLSHDLRTPLTAIRAHAFGLKQETLTVQGRESLQLIDKKIEYVGQLIENLQSFTLLESGRYPYRPERIDIVRMARTFIAGWYPAFEQHGFEIDINLPDEAVYWSVDPEWMERILDNYFQNVLRHAKSGRYVGFTISAENGGRMKISDRGPGIVEKSEERGAGIGLAIASLMLEEMGLAGEIVSGTGGTNIYIGLK